MVLFLYKMMIAVASPVLYAYLFIRMRRGKENKKRYKERFFGKTDKKRPIGKLVWMHGASVGECLSMMPLIKKILDEDKDAHVMVTSGTVSSAKMMAERLPARAFHQFIPVDFPWSAKRFVRHWKADAALWFESDFWPNILSEIRKSGAPLVLLNGRISDKSFKRYKRAKWYIKPILDLFSIVFGWSQKDAERLKKIGAQKVFSEGNLKFAAVSPVVDEKELAKMLGEIGNRPRLCGGSTHAGEEAMLARVHIEMKKAYPNFLTVSAPRHPPRGNEVEEIFKAAGLTVARRTRGEKITPEVDVYLADTIGEMGMIYQLANLVFVGGSLIPFGGQNMLEPMRLRRTVFVGPHTTNFTEIVEKAVEQKALVVVDSEKDLAAQMLHYLKHPDEAAAVAARAEKLATSEMAVLDRVYGVLRKEAGLK